jgi:regulatory protein
MRPRQSSGERRERQAAVDDVEKVLEAAARFLEVRQRSTAEVRTRLLTAGYRSELIDAAIERLTSLGYLDDASFAASWVESRDRARPRGETALRRELRVKGVDSSIIDQTLEGRRADAIEADAGDVTAADDVAAERLIDRHRRSLDRIGDPRVRRQRAYALLARNGFDPDTCRRVAAEVVIQAWNADEEL